MIRPLMKVPKSNYLTIQPSDLNKTFRASSYALDSSITAISKKFIVEIESYELFS